eukprot:TRINITY_DN6270_c0_g1_i1.p1 TRINITY_DN6270_c0_g1~~TRINITY_DN6270_c0_g1_i1.p1  ORF type:complete len:2170 (+),score=469.42 TRINITY_DN6270_c0_g1_i1:81-6590(+)
MSFLRETTLVLILCLALLIDTSCGAAQGVGPFTLVPDHGPAFGGSIVCAIGDVGCTGIDIDAKSAVEQDITYLNSQAACTFVGFVGSETFTGSVGSTYYTAGGSTVQADMYRFFPTPFVPSVYFNFDGAADFGNGIHTTSDPIAKAGLSLSSASIFLDDKSGMVNASLSVPSGNVVVPDFNAIGTKLPFTQDVFYFETLFASTTIPSVSVPWVVFKQDTAHRLEITSTALTWYFFDDVVHRLLMDGSVSSTLTTSYLFDGNTHHLAASANGSVARIYIDGAQVGGAGTAMIRWHYSTGSAYTADPTASMYDLGNGNDPLYISYTDADGSFVVYNATASDKVQDGGSGQQTGPSGIVTSGPVMYCPGSGAVNDPGPNPALSCIRVQRELFLVGMFVDEAGTAWQAQSQPSTMLVDENAVDVYPQVGQLYYIGDGFTPAGYQRRFHVPETLVRNGYRAYRAVMDSTNSNNAGSFNSIEITVYQFKYEYQTGDNPIQAMSGFEGRIDEFVLSITAVFPPCAIANHARRGRLGLNIWEEDIACLTNSYHADALKYLRADQNYGLQRTVLRYFGDQSLAPPLDYVGAGGVGKSLQSVTEHHSVRGAVVPLNPGSSDIFSVTVNGTACTSISQTATSLACDPGPLAEGEHAFTINSWRTGTMTTPIAIVAVGSPFVTQLKPTRGPAAGGYNVTVMGQNLFTGIGDVVSVTIDSLSLTVYSASLTEVVGLMPTGLSSGNRGFELTSLFQSVYDSGDVVFLLDPEPDAQWCTPNRGTWRGAQIITIGGGTLGNGSDITSVVVASVAATILWQNETMVIVRTGLSQLAVSGSVLIESVQNGKASSGPVYTYIGDLVVVTSGTNATAERNSAPITVYVSLSHPPSADNVTIDIASSTYAYSVPTSLTFTSANFNISQLVFVYAHQTNIADGDHDCTIQYGPVVDSYYDSAAQVTGTYLCRNSDVSGISLSEVSFPANSSLAEGGYIVKTLEAVNYAVRLTSEPMTSTTVTIVSGSNRVQLQPSSTLVFTKSNWNVTQTFNATHRDDGTLYDDPLTTTITVRTIASGSDYTAASSEATLVLLDVRSGSVIIFSAPNRNTTESGGFSVMYAIRTLLLQSPIVVNVASSLPTQGFIVNPIVTVTNDVVSVPIYINGTRNFIDDGDQPYTVSVSYTANSVTINKAFPLWNTDIDVAGFNISKASFTVNMTGSTDTFLATINSAPFADKPITVTLISNDTTAFVPVTARHVFNSTNWRTPAVFVLRGVRDDRITTDRNVSGIVSCTTADANYNARSFGIAVQNLYINFPTVSSVLPTVFPQIGTNCTISGAKFITGLQVMVGNITVATRFVNITSSSLNDTLTTVNATSLNRRLLNTNNTTAATVTATVLVFETPALNVTDYLNVTMINTDGGTTQYNGLFYTADCPYEGQFGKGFDCAPCPTGAYCPGGYRMWPLAGYWNINEFVGRVDACSPPEACLGGRNSSCAPLYQGTMCASCVTGYYKANSGLCEQCAAPNEQALLIFYQFLFVLVFLLCLITMNDSVVDHVCFLLIQFRILWVISVDSSYGMPTQLQDFFELLQLFVGDLNFVQPGCSGIQNFGQMFGVNVAFLTGTYIPTLVGIFLFSKLRARLLAWKYDRDYDDERERSWRFNRNMRGVVVLVDFIYELLLASAAKGVFCQNLGTKWVVAVEPDVECFAEWHPYVFVASIIILLGFNVCIPLWFGYLAIKNPFYGGHQQHLAPWVHSVTEHATDEFVPSMHLWGLACMFWWDMSLIFINLYTGNDLSTFIPTLIIVTSAIVMLIWKRPFRHWYKTVGALLTQTTSLMTALAKVFVYYGQLSAATAVSWIALVCIVLFFSGGAVLVLYGLLRLIYRRHTFKFLSDADEDEHNLSKHRYTDQELRVRCNWKVFKCWRPKQVNDALEEELKVFRDRLKSTISSVEEQVIIDSARKLHSERKVAFAETDLKAPAPDDFATALEAEVSRPRFDSWDQLASTQQSDDIGLSADAMSPLYTEPPSRPDDEQQQEQSLLATSFPPRTSPLPLLPHLSLPRHVPRAAVAVETATKLPPVGDYMRDPSPKPEQHVQPPAYSELPNSSPPSPRDDRLPSARRRPSRVYRSSDVEPVNSDYIPSEDGEDYEPQDIPLSVRVVVLGVLFFVLSSGIDAVFWFSVGAESIDTSLYSGDY